MKKQVTIESDDGQSLTVTRAGQSIDLTMVDGGGVAVGFALDIERAAHLANVLEMMVVDAIIERDKDKNTART